MHATHWLRRPLLVLTALVVIAAAACSAGDGGGPATTPIGTQPSVSAAPTTTPLNSNPTNSAPPDVGGASVVAVVEIVGGCAMMGPNCPTYVVWSDGRALVTRGTPPGDPFTTHLADDVVEGVGFIEPALAVELVRIVEETDFDQLVSRLGPGRCNACVDGADTFLSVATDDGVITLSSVDIDFDESEPFFATVAQMIGALGGALPLEVQSR